MSGNIIDHGRRQQIAHAVPPRHSGPQVRSGNLQQWNGQAHDAPARLAGARRRPGRVAGVPLRLELAAKGERAFQVVTRTRRHGNVREIDGFKFCYKICVECGYALRFFYPAVESTSEAVKGYRRWKRYLTQ